MINCTTRGKEAAIEPPKVSNKKPIVLSSQRFNKLLNNANQTDKLRAQKELEEEQKYKEYLKEGSDQLVAHFKGNIQRTQDEKLAEIKAHMEEKFTKSETCQLLYIKKPTKLLPVKYQQLKNPKSRICNIQYNTSKPNSSISIKI
uniref:Zygote defective protein 12 n=1 Tax=Zeugodacus cucurbitae TaxID=28588 RepID=A0A0A1XNK4_ZEUCU